MKEFGWRVHFWGGTRSSSFRGSGNVIMETGIVDTRYSIAHRAVVRCVISRTVLQLSAQANVIPI
jgi:hypothetical protein